MQKTNQKEFRVEKVIRIITQVLTYMLNGKTTIILLTVGLAKKTLYK